MPLNLELGRTGKAAENSKKFSFLMALENRSLPEIRHLLAHLEQAA